ncbi:MAG: hypothetical protein LRY67_06080 [Gammaproteobacteria bacterium]|nr:hypothetical protein [Gammaproteobacteria bacterium]
MRDRLKRLNTEPHYTITTQDLPLCCPGKNMTIVDAHPRVFLFAWKRWGGVVSLLQCEIYLNQIGKK